MNPDRLAQTFIALCRIPSPSGKEERISRWIRARLESLGCSVIEDDAGRRLDPVGPGNLIVRLPERGSVIRPGKHREVPTRVADRRAPASDGSVEQESLFVAAHMDTVALPFEVEVPVRVNGDRVDTGGACVLGGDDKVGVALALELIESAVEHPEQLVAPLEAVFTVREELGVLGARQVEATLLTARQGYILDGETPIYSAIHRSPTKLRYMIEVIGKSAHAALDPHAGINAITAGARIAVALPTGILDDATTANVGLIEGGGPVNVVPDRCRILGELRSLDAGALAAWKRRMEQIVTEESTAARATARIEWETVYHGYELGDEERCAKLFRDAAVRSGHTPTLLTSRGGGDANHFNAKGLSCVVVGLGMEKIHTPEEFYLISRLEEASRLLERIFFRAGDA